MHTRSSMRCPFNDESRTVCARYAAVDGLHFLKAPQPMALVEIKRVLRHRRGLPDAEVFVLPV